MKILMISSYLPYPLHNGGHIRLYNLIKNLSLNNEITLICEKRDFQSQNDIEEVRKICHKVVTVNRQKQWSIKNIFNTAISDKPFLITGHTSEEMRNLIRDELVKDKYDLIHIETFYVYQNLPENVNIPVVLVEHNIEYLVYKRYSDLANPLIRPFLNIDIFKLKKQEEFYWNKANKLVSVSEIERKLMTKQNEIVPNGVDTNLFKFKNIDLQKEDEKRILFIGDFKWLQNRDALSFILEKIWPITKKRLLDNNELNNIKLWIVGKNLPSEFLKYQESNIIFDINNNEQAFEIFRKSYILLAPLRVGGGTSYKILEAMSTGVGVVTTNLGIAGLGAIKNVHVLSGESEAEISDNLINLLHDKSLYRKLTINSRKFVEENFDWKIIAQKLIQVYKTII